MLVCLIMHNSSSQKKKLVAKVFEKPPLKEEPEP